MYTQSEVDIFVILTFIGGILIGLIIGYTEGYGRDSKHKIDDRK